MEFGAQTQYGRVTYPPFGNFIRSNKNYTFRGQKGKKKPSEPKNRIWGSKSVWSCDIFAFFTFKSIVFLAPYKIPKR
jgi:hypothetical protein